MLAKYRVGFRPEKHLFDVLLEIDGIATGELELWMPSWTPGSYLIREYARNVQEVRAEGPGGQPLQVERVSEDAWRVVLAGQSVVRVSYSVYAFDLSVRTSYLDESHAYFNGASLFLTCDALQDRPATVVLDLPPGWKVETSLACEEEDCFRARDYHELCDSPVHCGPDDRSVDFSVGGIPHRLAVWGNGNEDLPALGSALAAIVEQAAKVFGGLPYQRYLFLTLLTDRGRGGLEHRESSTLLYPRFGFRPEKSRQDFLQLAAHELFHAWIVKRLRPLALTPYRYRTENFTRLLWFFEGFTSYYEVLLCLRAGLLSTARFLELWGERMTQLARTPGRRFQSLEDASLTAWVKFYRQDENSPNSSVSYYLKGSLVALALEGELRGCGSSLDQLMRTLWSRYGSPETGLPEDAIRKVAEELAQAGLPRVFDAVSGIDDPSPASLEALGLRVGTRAREGINNRGGSPPRNSERDKGANLGLTFKSDRLAIQSVHADGPAELAGLCADDELVAADGFRLTPENCVLRLEQRAPGTELKLTYFRHEELRQTVLTLGERAQDTYWIERVNSPSEEQRKAFFEWTGSRL